MSKSIKSTERFNVLVELWFNPKIGSCAIKYYDEMIKRCEQIDKLLKPVGLYCIRFNNPYTYGYYRRVKYFSFEVDEKAWLPNKKIKLLKKILSSKAMKNQGLEKFKIKKVKEVITINREFTEVE